MCQAEILFNLARWYKLTPDLNGSYLNGSWTSLASMPEGYVPLAAAEAVLADGRVVMIGGEYNNLNFALTNAGAIYDPQADVWTVLAPPPFDHFQCIGDAPSTILTDGRLIVGTKLYQDLAILDPATLSWTLVSATGKTDAFNSEEGWTLLPDGSFFTLDVRNAPASERFLLTGTATGFWTSAGNTPQDLHTPGRAVQLTALGCPVYRPPGEIGPTLLRPDGTVFAIGADGHTGIYTPPAAGSTATGTWAAGPSFQGLNVEDGPAAVLPSGHVLFGASPGEIQPGLEYFEFDGANLNPVPAPANAANDASTGTSLLLLPTGEVMFVDGTNTVQLYTSAASPTFDPAWAPTISSVPEAITAGSTYQINGTQFNGLDQGTSFGDEYQNATNYPLVRIANNTTGHIFYARTHDHSSMGVATGRKAVYTYFDVPTNIEAGASTIEVVANGIPSAAAAVTVTVAAGGEAPTVTTGAASAVISASATLNGSVNPDGADTQVWFEYSTNSSMNGSTSTLRQDVGAGTHTLPFSSSVTGLGGSATYYYRAWATNGMGTSHGTIASFTQTSLPAGYNNLGPGNSFAQSNWCITGIDNADCGPPALRVVAAPFTSGATFPLNQISLALSSNGGTNSAQISLLQDAGGLPGNSLESWTVSSLPNSFPPELTTVEDRLNLTLEAGQQYWVEVQPSATGTDTLLLWFMNGLGLGSAFTDVNGSGWRVLGNQPAFEVGLAAPPTINPFGVVSASAFGGFGKGAPGAWIEIYGSNLAAGTRTWASSDFDGGRAPTELEGTTVTIGGLPAFVSFVSPSQVNIQVPSGAGTGWLPLIVTTQAGGPSNPYLLAVNAAAPSLLAPPSFNVDGQQYVVALFPDYSTYVLPTGAVAGVNARPAHPGDTIILYGIGFGPVIPDIPAGQVVPEQNTLASPFQIFFAGVRGTVSYNGLAPDYVGLYQFNVVVPAISGGNFVPVTFTLSGVPGPQALYIAVE